MVWRITYLPLITQLWVGEDICLVSHSGWLGADGPDCTWADAVGRWSFLSSLENTFGQFTFLNKNRVAPYLGTIIGICLSLDYFELLKGQVLMKLFLYYPG